MKLSQPTKELLAMHESFRRLGFPAAELFVAPHTSGRVQFLLQRHGQQFTVDIPGRITDEATFITEWERATEWWNNDATTTAERNEVMAASELLEKVGNVTLVASLVARGFYPLA